MRWLQRVVPLALFAACSCGDAAHRTSRSIPPAPAVGDGGPSAAAAEEQALVGPVELTADMAAPYFAGGAAGEAAARFAIEDWQGARAGFAALLASDAAPNDAGTRARIHLLIAVADANLGNWQQAAAGFEHAAAQLPLVADYALYHAARARYFTRDVDAALAHAQKVSAHSTMAAEAQLLVGDVLRAQGRWDDVAAHYAAYLERRSRGPRLDEATFRLAEAHDRKGRARQALEHYQRVTIRWPVSTPWAEQAQSRIDALARSLPAADRKPFESLAAGQHLERGLALHDAMRNPQAAAALDAALRAGGLSERERCVAAYHRANSWWKERDRTKSAPLFDQAMAICAGTEDTDLKVKSAYQAGRSYAMLGDHQVAAARYAEVEAFDHTYADDARMRRAEEHTELGDHARVTELLSTLPDLYPDGDMRAEATWRLAFRAWVAKDYREAIKWLDKQIEIMPIDTRWYGEGQAQYWKGRAYAELGEAERSIAAYEQAVKLYPLSYYALLALNRLRESHPSRFEALAAELQAPPAGFDPSQPAFDFTPRELYGTQGFWRALEFLRLGLGDQAERELTDLGLHAPGGRDEVTDPDTVDKLWAMAFLYDRAGRYDKSHWPTRWHILGYKRHWPAGHARARWRIAYPLGFGHLIEEHARKHGYPWALQMAIVREESAFNPILESWANAIGLTQMIFPTAERFAKGTGIAVNRENLRDPEKNVTIGSRFLAFLHQTFEGRVGLMVPSYNAGEGATWRWMFARQGWDWDAWEEAIPGDQARNYTKRVISSYFAYSYLNDGTIPPMPNDVPLRLIPDWKLRQFRK